MYILMRKLFIVYHVLFAMLELCSCQWFGHGVGYDVFSRAILQSDFLFFNALADEMMRNIYVFGSLMVCQIIHKCDCQFVVLLNSCWALLFKTKFY